MPVDSPQMLSPALLGRVTELAALEQAQFAAQQGRGGCVLVAGEAGIGKSRLVAELRRHAVGEPFLLWEGHCFEQDSSFPFAPWIDALRGFLAPKSPAETGQLLSPLASEFVKLLPELALLLPDLRPNPALDAESDKRRLFETVARFAAQLAAARPLLIVLEDLHWGDDSSLELLHFFARRIAALPILLVGTYRNDESSPRFSHYLAELNRERLVREIRLAPLARSEIEQLAAGILKSELSLGTAWFEDFISLSEGNPFFAEEMLKSLAETAEPDTWRIPRSLQEAVERRVARLPEDTRRILALAAVIGERFDFGLLQEITAQNEQSLLSQLRALIAAQLIVEQSADQFGFRHALTRQAVHGMLLLRERRAMHQAIGAALERSAGVGADPAAALLAYHFYQGGVWDRALAYSQRAAEQAQALYAPREALMHFGHALDSARHLGRAAPLAALHGRARMREVLADFAGARTDYEAALDAARGQQERASEWQALIDLGLLWQARDLVRAGEYYEQALALAENLRDPARLGQTLNRAGNWHMNLGRPREALSYHQQALALYEARDDRHGLAETLDLLGIVSYQLGEVVQGAAYLERAVPIFRALDDRQGLVHALTNLGVRALLDNEVLGDVDFRQLIETTEEALQIARGFHWYHGEALALLQGAICLRQAGEYGRALAWLDQAQPLVNESGNRETLARFHLIYGETLVGLLAPAEARGHLETALAHLQQLGTGLLLMPAQAQLAALALLENDLQRSRAILAALLPAAYPEGHELAFRSTGWSVRAELELRQGQPRAALAILDPMLAATPNLAQFGPYAVPRLSRLRGLALAAMARTGEAESELQGALRVAHSQGLRPLVWRVHADLGTLYRARGRREDAEREFSAARALIQELADGIPAGPLRANFLARALPAAAPRRAAKTAFWGLTAREREVAALIAAGKSNREIAQALVIGESTAERHVANILAKLGFNSRTQIAVWALDKGLSK